MTLTRQKSILQMITSVENNNSDCMNTTNYIDIAKNVSDAINRISSLDFNEHLGENGNLHSKHEHSKSRSK